MTTVPVSIGHLSVSGEAPRTSQETSVIAHLISRFRSNSALTPEQRAADNERLRERMWWLEEGSQTILHGPVLPPVSAPASAALRASDSASPAAGLVSENSRTPAAVTRSRPMTRVLAPANLVFRADGNHSSAEIASSGLGLSVAGTSPAVQTASTRARSRSRSRSRSQLRSQMHPRAQHTDVAPAAAAAAAATAAALAALPSKPRVPSRRVRPPPPASAHAPAPAPAPAHTHTHAHIHARARARPQSHAGATGQAQRASPAAAPLHTPGGTNGTGGLTFSSLERLAPATAAAMRALATGPHTAAALPLPPQVNTPAPAPAPAPAPTPVSAQASAPAVASVAGPDMTLSPRARLLQRVNSRHLGSARVPHNAAAVTATLQSQATSDTRAPGSLEAFLAAAAQEQAFLLSEPTPRLTPVPVSAPDAGPGAGAVAEACVSAACAAAPGARADTDGYVSPDLSLTMSPEQGEPGPDGDPDMRLDFGALQGCGPTPPQRRSAYLARPRGNVPDDGADADAGAGAIVSDEDRGDADADADLLYDAVGAEAVALSRLLGPPGNSRAPTVAHRRRTGADAAAAAAARMGIESSDLATPLASERGGAGLPSAQSYPDGQWAAATQELAAHDPHSPHSLEAHGLSVDDAVDAFAGASGSGDDYDSRAAGAGGSTSSSPSPPFVLSPQPMSALAGTGVDPCASMPAATTNDGYSHAHAHAHASTATAVVPVAAHLTALGPTCCCCCRCHCCHCHHHHSRAFAAQTPHSPLAAPVYGGHGAAAAAVAAMRTACESSFALTHAHAHVTAAPVRARLVAPGAVPAPAAAVGGFPGGPRSNAGIIALGVATGPTRALAPRPAARAGCGDEDDDEDDLFEERRLRVLLTQLSREAKEEMAEFRKKAKPVPAAADAVGLSGSGAVSSSEPRLAPADASVARASAHGPPSGVDETVSELAALVAPVDSTDATL